MRKLVGKLIVVASFLLLVSCASEEVLPKVYSDAFIITKEVDGESKSGLAFHTYANVAMKSVIVESESGEINALGTYDNSAYEFYMEVADTDFSTSLPETGEYTFTVTTSEGDVITETNELAGDAIDPVEITSCEFSSTNNRIELKWEASADADYAVVVLRNDEGEVVYFNNSLSSTATSTNIPSSGWVSDLEPVQGSTYEVELSVFLLESSDSDFMESKAITTYDIVWENE
ncbi:hypothetical protein [Mangrovibacterium sp.]|uniref:hypothetical protein n=1 Tax=Mangrovibacterium sp. TaxID=1961364 RepID=UPI003569580B